MKSIQSSLACFLSSNNKSFRQEPKFGGQREWLGLQKPNKKLYFKWADKIWSKKDKEKKVSPLMPIRVLYRGFDSCLSHFLRKSKIEAIKNPSCTNVDKRTKLYVIFLNDSHSSGGINYFLNAFRLTILCHQLTFIYVLLSIWTEQKAFYEWRS